MLLVAAALAGVTFAGPMTPWLLPAMTFLLGLGSALNAPAWQATTPDLVPREEVPAAVALAGISMNGARAVGPALGGLFGGMAARGSAGDHLVPPPRRGRHGARTISALAGNGGIAYGVGTWAGTGDGGIPDRPGTGRGVPGRHPPPASGLSGKAACATGGVGLCWAHEKTPPPSCDGGGVSL